MEKSTSDSPKPDCRLMRMPGFWEVLPADSGLSCKELSEKDKEDIDFEIRRQLKDKLLSQAFCGTLDKQAYQMEKNQMFRRLQTEKEERTLQDCMCKSEKDRCKQERRHNQEENFAVALQRLKEEEIREAAFRKQLQACAPEIREVERQIRRAYYAKTLYAQRLEGEALKLEDKMRQLENDELLMERLRKENEEEWKKEQEACQRKWDYMKTLKAQMEGSGSKQAQKYEEFQRDKQIIDEIVDTIQKEEIEDLIEKRDKVKLYQSEIEHFLKSREMHRQREKERKEEEERKIKEFIVQKEEQAAAQGQAKAARDAAKAAIVAKTIERIMTEQFKSEEMEELRRELYEEELAEEVRRKEAEEAEKKYRQMIELQQAEVEAKKLRAEKLEAERQEIEDYRRELMTKFAEDERLEQLSNEKRRQKERDHRKKIEEMVLERRALRAEEREKEQETRNCFDADSKRRANMCDEERLRLLKKHGPNILGFIPRGVLRCGDIEKLGEPFVSYYKNLRREPDPSTIDAEPCEEELFRNMTLSSSAKY